MALGTFDGVHLGHRRVIETARDAGLRSTVVTFDPHPRAALGNQVDLLSTLERRLELLAELGVDETLVVDFTLDLARLDPAEFADEVLRPIDAEIIVAGEDFRFGRGRRGDLDTLLAHGFEVRPVELLEGVSSTRIREVLHEGRVDEAAQLLGRPFEVEGMVVAGDARGRHARVSPRRTSRCHRTCSCPPSASTPAARSGTGLRSRSGRIRTTAAGSGGSSPTSWTSTATSTGSACSSSSGSACGTNGRSTSEAELIAEIARDVEKTRTAIRPI